MLVWPCKRISLTTGKQTRMNYRTISFLEDKKMKHFFLVIALLLSVCANAQIEKALPPRPNPPRLVNDYANLLTPEQEQALEAKLVAYDDSTSNQIAVVIVESLNGYEANQFATELGEEWGVGGQARFDNGVVVLVSTGGDAGDLGQGPLAHRAPGGLAQHAEIRSSGEHPRFP